VTDAALDVGYASVSAFVSAFRHEFGVTPGRFEAG
jgi:AraC-like DNA-binding protein